MEYLTPRKLRSMGLGTALPADDLELRSLIRIGTGLVNRAATAPRMHDFRGGSVINEQHEWDIGNDHIPGKRRLWPYHRPIKKVNRFHIRVTQGSTGVVDFPAEQIYINAQENYLELVSLSLSTASVFAAGLIPNIGLAKPVAELDYDYGWDYSVTGEDLATVSGGRTYYTESQFWTDDPVTVRVAGVDQTTGFTLDRTEGSVTFDVAPWPSSADISYTHRLHPDIVMATAMITADVAAYTRVNRAGLQGLSSIRVLEVELRQGKSSGLSSVPINPSAQMLLDSFKYRSFA